MTGPVIGSLAGASLVENYFRETEPDPVIYVPSLERQSQHVNKQTTI